MPQSQDSQDYVEIPGPDNRPYRFPKGTTPERAQAYFAKKGIGKPSAAVGRPIPVPGGAGTNYATGPRAGPPPPVAAAGGATTPGAGVPPDTTGFGPTGMLGISAGIAKRGGQEAINALQFIDPTMGGMKALMQTQPGQAVTSALQPKGSLQEFGADAADILEYMIPVGGEEKAGIKAAELAEKYVPKLVQGITRKAAQDGIGAVLAKLGIGTGEQAVKAAYQALTGTATGAVQGRDPIKSGAEAGATSLVFGTLGKMSPPLLRSLFNVKDIRTKVSGGDVGKMMLKVSGLTRKALTKNSARELQDVEGQIARSMSTRIPVGLTPGGQRQFTGTTFNINTILDTVEKKTFDPNIPTDEGRKIQNFLKDVERFSDSVAPGRVKTLSAQIGKKTEDIDKLQAKLNAGLITNPDIIAGIGAGITKRQQDIAEMKRLIANQPAKVSSIKLNNFRKTLDENYMPYGKDPSTWTEGEKLVKWVHDQITGAMKKDRPEIDQLLKDSYSLRDLKGAMLKEERKSFGLHTIMDPAQLPRTLPPWVGWQVGHKAGGPALGLLGAITAGGARVPTAAAAKTMASPFTKGAVTGISNVLSNTPEDWSKKGKKTPYGPME